MHILIYSLANGKEPFVRWLNSLKDNVAQAKIKSRLNRIRLGNLGDFKSVGGGVFELRIDFGPGYRVYFGKRGSELVLLLSGGSKKTQVQDIRNAKLYWEEYLNHEKT